MAPKVLVSDKLSETAVHIFIDRGIEVDFMPDLGKDKEALANAIGNYDGLAIRSATKVTPNILKNAHKLKVIGRAGIGTDNIDKEAASKKGHMPILSFLNFVRVRKQFLLCFLLRSHLMFCPSVRRP